MNDSVETMIRQTIEMLFEEHTTDQDLLEPVFQALIEFSERFDISSTNIIELILETAERKNFENGIVAAQFMNFLRHLRKGPWEPYDDPPATSSVSV